MRRRPWWWRLRWLARRVKVELRRRAVDVSYWVRPPQLLEGGRRVWRWNRPPLLQVVINHEPEGYEDVPPADYAPAWATRQRRLAFEVERLRARLGFPGARFSATERFFAELEEDARRDR